MLASFSIEAMLLRIIDGLQQPVQQRLLKCFLVKLSSSQAVLGLSRPKPTRPQVVYYYTTQVDYYS